MKTSKEERGGSIIDRCPPPSPSITVAVFFVVRVHRLRVDFVKLNMRFAAAPPFEIRASPEYFIFACDFSAKMIQANISHPGADG